jgi:hypothetical protein
MARRRRLPPGGHVPKGTLLAQCLHGHTLPRCALSPEPFKAKAYLKEGCPFSFKFWLFMVEANLSDQIEVIRCNPDDAAFAAVKAKLSAALRKPASFPTVEIEPGRYQADSDVLIEHYATKNGIDASRLPTLAFYKETIFPQLQELHERKSHAKP